MKKILPIYIILNMIFITICSSLIINGVMYYKLLSYGYIFFLVLNIIMIFFIKKKFSVADVFLLCIVLFSFISVIFAKNRTVAIWGEFIRYEGLFSILYYLTLYYVSSYVGDKYKKIVIYSFLFCGFINLVYSIFLVTNVGDFKRVYVDNRIWANGFTTNPNFFATYMLLCLGYSIGLFIDEKNNIFKFINASLIFLFMIGILISNTMSCVVGTIAILIYVIIHCIKNKKFIKVPIIIALILLAFILIYSADLTTLKKDFIKTVKQTKEIAKGNLDDKFGTNRLFIWKNTMKIVPKYLLTGAGIDNFYYAFGDRPLKNGKWVFDKAHNEYLQTLICEGIFGLVSYLLLYGIIIIRGIKNKKIYLLIPVIGYLTQAFFNISVIEVAPFFYISLGLLVDRGILNEESKCNNTCTQ